MHNNPFNPMNSPKPDNKFSLSGVSESFDSDEVDCKHYVYEYGFEDNDEYCKKGWDINYCSFCKYNKAKDKSNSH